VSIFFGKSSNLAPGTPVHCWGRAFRDAAESLANIFRDKVQEFINALNTPDELPDCFRLRVYRGYTVRNYCALPFWELWLRGPATKGVAIR